MEGDLREFALAEILQFVSLGSRTGVLEILRRDGVYRIAFTSGGITGLSADGWTVDQELRLSGLIPTDAVSNLLTGVLGDENLLAYNDPKSLYDKRDEVWERIAALTRAWTTADLMEAMLAVDIWCGEVKTHLQVKDDPQVRHMGAITAYEHPRAGRVEVVAPAVRLSETPAAITRPAPLVGEHTEEILREAGFSEEEVRGFLTSGAVATAA